MHGDVWIGMRSGLFVALVLRSASFAWNFALARAAEVGARALPALTRRASRATRAYEWAREEADTTRVRYAAALKMDKAYRLKQMARLCEDQKAYEEATAEYERAYAIYEGCQAHTGLYGHES